MIHTNSSENNIDMDKFNNDTNALITKSVNDRVRNRIADILKLEFEQYEDIVKLIEPDLNKTIEQLSKLNAEEIILCRGLDNKIHDLQIKYDKLLYDYQELKKGGGSKKSNKKRKHNKRGTKKRC